MSRPFPEAPPPLSTAAAGHRIVTSLHLVSPKSPELSELEFGLIIFNHAFSRWMVRCMAAAGGPVMTALDVLVLHIDKFIRASMGGGPRDLLLKALFQGQSASRFVRPQLGPELDHVRTWPALLDRTFGQWSS